MSNSFFYTQVSRNPRNDDILSKLEAYSNKHKKQIYVVNRPLADKDVSFGYDDGFLLMSPGYSLVFMSFEKTDEFEEYQEDFIDDIYSISKKYKFVSKIGRPRAWKDVVTKYFIYNDATKVSDIFKSFKIDEHLDRRISDILISLVTGSINDSAYVEMDYGGDILEKVKQKILLFDGDQTRFIYSDNGEKVTTIQGMSGTGKTELLLHKLKEVYIENEDRNVKIALTCHNEILASSLRDRLPSFFNYMRVDKQIEWNEKLWCIRAWGSESDQNSGIYSKICKFYDASFQRYNYGVDFDYVCKEVLDFIKKSNLVKSKGFVFDYFFIDESQDFGESFFELIKLVTKEKVFVAGDIFQSIFENYKPKNTPDFLLNKCYRTDPRTLMFSHSIGLGLFESPKLSWLTDEQWEAYGYHIKVAGRQYELSRDKLLRFEDIQDSDHSSVQLINADADIDVNNFQAIIDVIKNIKKEYPTVKVDDIGIIFLANANKTVVSAAETLSYYIKDVFGWEVNKAFETRRPMEGKLFVSSKNHVKGLEFPFVICVAKNIQSSESYRNSLYMVLTRSFLKSYFLISEANNPGLIDRYQKNLDFINENNFISVEKPTDEEIKKMENNFKVPKEKIKDLFEISTIVFDEYAIHKGIREDVFDFIKTSVDERNVSLDSIRGLVDWYMSFRAV